MPLPKPGPWQIGSAPTCAIVISAFSLHRLHGIIQDLGPFCELQAQDREANLLPSLCFQHLGPVCAQFLPQTFPHPDSDTQCPFRGSWACPHLALLWRSYSCFCMELIGQLSSFPLLYLLGAEEPFPRFPTGQHHTIDRHLPFLTQNTGLSLMQ